MHSTASANRLLLLDTAVITWCHVPRKIAPYSSDRSIQEAARHSSVHDFFLDRRPPGGRAFFHDDWQMSIDTKFVINKLPSVSPQQKIQDGSKNSTK